VKLDLSKEYKSYYTAKTTPEIVDIGEGKFLLEGKGAPGGESFRLRLAHCTLLLTVLKC